MNGTVLVVDDHARPRRALAIELEDANFRVNQAADGVEAWEWFCREQPDVVVTDCAMPRSDGRAAIAAMPTNAPSVIIDRKVSPCRDGIDPR